MFPSTHDLVKLVNARFVDVENGCYFPHLTSLVIQNGKIIAMPGLAGESDYPAVDAEIDLHGLTVIPALLNTHSHLQFLPRSEVGKQQVDKNLRDCIDRGITNVRDTLCYDLRLNQDCIDRISHGDIQGPRIHQAIHVSPLGGTYAPRINPKTRFTFSLIGLKLVDYSLKTSGVVAFRPDAGVQEVRDAVNRAVDERGAKAIKFCDQPEHFMTYKPGAEVITSEQLTAAVDQADKRGMPSTMHNVTVAGFRQGVRAGIGSLAHLPLDSELVEADALLLSNSRTYIEPTLSVSYYMSYSIKGSPYYGHPEIQRLDRYRDQTYQAAVKDIWLPEMLPTRIGMNDALSKGEMKVFRVIDISEPFRYFTKMVPIGWQNLRLFVKHGGVSRLACGNDAGPTNTSTAAVQDELAMFDFVLNYENPTITSG